MNLFWAGPTCGYTKSVIITPMFDLLGGIKRKSRQNPFSMLNEKRRNRAEVRARPRSCRRKKVNPAIRSACGIAAGNRADSHKVRWPRYAS
jgi:hypothetical protein